MAVRKTTLVTGCVHWKRKFKKQTELKKHKKQVHEKLKERYRCEKCEKHFGQLQTLELHMKVHEAIQIPQEKDEACEKNMETAAGIFTQCTAREQTSSPSKKPVGLTKIRLEDCLRCDECSCIYLHENDYNKHMKNFHREDSPRKHRQRKGCRSCCKHCNCREIHHNIQKERGNNNLFHYNIKDRWSKMVSRRLDLNKLISQLGEYAIKPDPDHIIYPDYSDLLSKVEVKIKTEPADDYNQQLSLGIDQAVALTSN